MQTNVQKVLVLCPKTTVLNWVDQYNGSQNVKKKCQLISLNYQSTFSSLISRFVDINTFNIQIFVILFLNNYRHKPEERMAQIEKWHESKGVLISGYAMFRSLVQHTLYNEDEMTSDETKKSQMLIHPGPDLVVCDEGHLLKNDKTSISDVLSNVRTIRRIVLTGTPLQNNLDEYFCMVNVVKPHLLGTRAEFTNRFANPIMNGQYVNSTPRDIQVMKRRSHVLHKLLDGIVHRADISSLTPFLKPKHEYVLYIRLTPIQIKLYSV